MRKILCVAVLMLALCCPTLAGEMPTPPAPQPTPSTADGTLQTDDPAPTDADGGQIDILTQIVITVLVSVLP